MNLLRNKLVTLIRVYAKWDYGTKLFKIFVGIILVIIRADTRTQSYTFGDGTDKHKIYPYAKKPILIVRRSKIVIYVIM